MSALGRLIKLRRRLDEPLVLRYDPKDALSGHCNVRVDAGRGVWVVAIDRPGPEYSRVLDGLAAGRTVREAVRNAERAVDRRLVTAEYLHRGIDP